MKKIFWAVGALIIIIAFAFIFTAQNNNDNENIPRESGQNGRLSQLLESTMAAENNNLSFPLLDGEEIKNTKIRINTNKGEMVIELFENSPLAASNFISLTNKKFYDGLTFHRIINGFMIQGGDPKGDGTGDPGYRFKDEPVSREYKRGIVAMANAGPNTNGSQFFILHQDYPLPPNYTIFGNVISGIEVVDAIAQTPVDANDKPTEPVIINTVTTDKE